MIALWRVFPWDPDPAEGDPFSKTSVPANQGSGRFDLPGKPAGVLYTAETPDHAVAEVIQGIRGYSLEAADLDRSSHRLALVRIDVVGEVASRIADLCDPEVLTRHGIRPDSLASRDRGTTQGIALRLADAGNTGLRWWSSLSGDWHSVVLFREAVAVEGMAVGDPERLELDHQAVVDAAAALGIEISEQ